MINWPYSDIHTLNLDWIITKVKTLDDEFNDKLITTIEEYINEHMADFTISANYNQDTETIVYTNGTDANQTLGDVKRFAIDNVFVNVKDETSRTQIQDIQSINAASRLTAIENAINTLNALYSVGSIITTYNNVNPGTIYGGTWELIDKALYPGDGQAVNGTITYYTETNGTMRDLRYIRTANYIMFRMGFTPNVDLAETNVQLCSINPEAFGVTQLGSFNETITAYSDTGNALLSLLINTNGNIVVTDAWTINATPSHSVPANTALDYITFTVYIDRIEHKIDVESYTWVRLS